MQEVMFHFLLDTIHKHAIWKNGEANLICHVGKRQPLRWKCFLPCKN